MQDQAFIAATKQWAGTSIGNIGSGLILLESASAIPGIGPVMAEAHARLHPQFVALLNQTIEASHADTVEAMLTEISTHIAMIHGTVCAQFCRTVTTKFNGLLVPGAEAR